MAKKLSTKEKVSYGLGAIGKDMACGIIFTYATIFFTDVLGLAAGFVGSLFFLARFWDALNDLAMGVIIQNTKTRWGKFRPWLMIGTIINSIVLIVMFTNWHLEGRWLYIFAAVMYVLWGMTYTIMDIPYWSMLPNLTSDPQERDQVAIIPRVCAAIGGSLIISGLGLQIMNFLANGQGAFVGYTRFAWLIVIVFVVTIAITCLNVKSADRVEDQQSTRKVSFKDMFDVIRKNDQLLIAIAVILMWNAAGQFIGAVQLYYFKYAIGNESMFTYFALFGAVAVIAGLFLYPIVARKLRRQQIYALAIAIPTTGLVMLGLIGLIPALRENAILTGLCGILWQLGGGLQTGIVTVVLADVVDYGEYKLGTRDESVIFSLQTLLVKLTSAFGVLITGFVLQATGYVPDTEQTANTIMWLRIVMIVIPIVFIFISFIIYISKYKLNRVYMKRIQTILSLRREGKTEDENMDDEAIEAQAHLQDVMQCPL